MKDECNLGAYFSSGPPATRKEASGTGDNPPCILDPHLSPLPHTPVLQFIPPSFFSPLVNRPTLDQRLPCHLARAKRRHRERETSRQGREVSPSFSIRAASPEVVFWLKGGMLVATQQEMRHPYYSYGEKMDQVGQVKGDMGDLAQRRATRTCHSQCGPFVQQFA